MNNSKKLPAVFWTIAAVALVWNIVGVAAYVMEVTISDEAMTALPQPQQALYAAQPAWVTVAFALAVFAGLAGSIALLLRNSLATSIFLISLIAVVAQMFYLFAVADLIEVMGPGSAIMPSLIVVIAGALLWFSTRATNKGWIG